MIKDIKYEGFTAQPSDYESPDGDLALSYNMVHDKGSLRSFCQPQSLFHLPFSDARVLCIHKVNESTLYILAHNADGMTQVSFCEQGGPVQGEGAVNTIFSANSVLSAVPIGNTLAFATDKGLVYAIWQTDKYIFLGSHPDIPEFSFGLEETGSFSGFFTEIPCDAETKSVVAKYLPSDAHIAGISRPPSNPNRKQNIFDAFFESLSNCIYGQIFSKYNSICEYGMYFYQPFFIRYAFRLFDGSYSWHSAPVLMLPTTIPPNVTTSTGSFEDNVYRFNAQIGVKYFSLLFSTVLEGNLSLWKDIVAGIDFFISAPLYTFDQSKSIKGYGTDGYNKTKRVVAQGGNQRGRDNIVTYVTTTHRLLGIYRESGTVQFKRHLLDTENPHWRFPSRESKLNEDIRSTHLFYRIASISLSDIPQASAGYIPLPIEDGVSPDSLVSRPTLPDEFGTRHRFAPRVVHSYNSRLHIADINVHLAPPPPLKSLICAEESSADYIPSVTYRYNGSSREAVRASLSSADRIPSPASCPPVFLYIHDSNATFLSLYEEDDDGASKGFDIPLKPHDFLNGAYWFSGFDIPVDESLISDFDSGAPVPLPATPVIRKPSALYVSEVNNPFLFPVSYALSVGDGKVDALASAAKALSQGQFGQFPLYAFTGNGVWALETSQTGTYIARQPITRDICCNPKGIVQLDSAVLFPSARGIMMLAGSSASCISDAIYNDKPFNVGSLPKFEVIESVFDGAVSDALDSFSFVIAPFSQFISGCEMIYDYIHQRIIVFNSDFYYAYVYSIDSRSWSTIYSNIKSAVNSYPHAYAVTRDAQLVNYSGFEIGDNGEPIPYPGLIITRPLKLDAPDILKTVESIIQRGVFAKGRVQSVLYGSRNMDDWHLIWSSKDHFLRGFRGTPYKYFRIALLCFLSPGESIYGASVMFTPRFTNQSR